MSNTFKGHPFSRDIVTVEMDASLYGHFTADGVYRMNNRGGNLAPSYPNATTNQIIRIATGEFMMFGRHVVVHTTTDLPYVPMRDPRLIYVNIEYTPGDTPLNTQLKFKLSPTLKTKPAITPPNLPAFEMSILSMTYNAQSSTAVFKWLNDFDKSLSPSDIVGNRADQLINERLNQSNINPEVIKATAENAARNVSGEIADAKLEEYRRSGDFTVDVQKAVEPLMRNTGSGVLDGYYRELATVNQTNRVDGTPNIRLVYFADTLPTMSYNEQLTKFVLSGKIIARIGDEFYPVSDASLNRIKTTDIKTVYTKIVVEYDTVSTENFFGYRVEYKLKPANSRTDFNHGSNFVTIATITRNDTGLETTYSVSTSSTPFIKYTKMYKNYTMRERVEILSEMDRYLQYNGNIPVRYVPVNPYNNTDVKYVPNFFTAPPQMVMFWNGVYLPIDFDPIHYVDQNYAGLAQTTYLAVRFVTATGVNAHNQYFGLRMELNTKVINNNETVTLYKCEKNQSNSLTITRIKGAFKTKDNPASWEEAIPNDHSKMIFDVCYPIDSIFVKATEGTSNLQGGWELHHTETLTGGKKLYHYKRKY